MLSVGQVQRAERDMNTLTARINEAVKHRGESRVAQDEWKKAAAALHAYEHPVFELWRAETLAGIRAGDRTAIEGALSFLEADPFFFRSGYLKEKVLHALKRAPLTGRDQARLQMVVLRAVEGRFKREFRFYVRLIPRLRTAQFEAELRATAKRAPFANHARLVLNALDSHT